MDFWGWVLLIVVIGVVGGIAQIVAVSNKKKAMEEKLRSLPDFSPTQRIMGNNGDTGIAIDEERKKIVLIKNGSAGVDLKPITPPHSSGCRMRGLNRVAAGSDPLQRHRVV